MCEETASPQGGPLMRNILKKAGIIGGGRSIALPLLLLAVTLYAGIIGGNSVLA